jgi:Yip1 domain
VTNPSSPGNTPIDAAPPAAAPTAVWEDFIDIFHSPSDVFARRQNGSFWVPMLVVAVLVGGLFFANSGVLAPLMDAEFQRGSAAAMRANPQITAEQMAAGRHIGEIAAKVGAFIFIPIVIFLMGFFLWIIGKLFDASESFHTAVVVAAYSMVPAVIGGVLAGVQGLFMDPASLTGRGSISLGPARFFNPDTTSPVLLAILNNLDVITIWITVLYVIGLSVTGKIPRARAAMAGVLLWALGIVPALIQAARS